MPAAFFCQWAGAGPEGFPGALDLQAGAVEAMPTLPASTVAALDQAGRNCPSSQGADMQNSRLRYIADDPGSLAQLALQSVVAARTVALPRCLRQITPLRPELAGWPVSHAGDLRRRRGEPVGLPSRLHAAPRALQASLQGDLGPSPSWWQVERDVQDVLLATFLEEAFCRTWEVRFRPSSSRRTTSS